MTGAELKKAVFEKALELGAGAVGCAPAQRWLDKGEVPEGYRPTDIWPAARTVITFGMPLSPMVLKNAPSIIYRDTYLAANRLLDEISLRLAGWLMAKGHPAMNLPYSGQVPEEQAKFRGLFSQVFAAKYAGLGRPGLAHPLVTKKWGPRIRLNSVLLAAELPSDEMLDENPCTNCNLCAKHCPVQAITPTKGEFIGNLNKEACSAEHKRLAEDNLSPCGICLKVCPIGEDLRMFRSFSAQNASGEACYEYSGR